MSIHARIAAALLAALFATAAAPATASTERELRFRVLLDDSPIGSQVFRVRDDGERESVSIEASMDVKILFLTAYSYRHRNEELWAGDCLEAIDSSTDDNGEKLVVSGKPAADGFLVERTDGRENLPACVRSFSYWAPDRLRAGRLLNSQTGKLETIRLRELGEATIVDRGREVRARHVALDGEKLHIELWYEVGSQEWLALESPTNSGRVLRYVRE